MRMPAVAAVPEHVTTSVSSVVIKQQNLAHSAWLQLLTHKHQGTLATRSNYIIHSEDYLGILPSSNLDLPVMY